MVQLLQAKWELWMKPVSVMVLLSCALLAPSCRGSGDRLLFGPVSFSPDGKTIVFSRGDGNECSIYKADLASGHAKRLTKTHNGCESDPTFSPDGKLIAYSYISAPGAKSALFVMNEDGSNGHQISSGSSDDLYPIFATDTHAVYFARARYFGHYSPIAKKRRHDLDLFSIDLRNSKVAEITEQHFFDAKSLCLSPDGKELLISTSRNSDSLFEVYQIDKPQSARRVIQAHVPDEPRAEVYWGDACYMPDGKTILAVVTSRDHCTIYVVDTETGRVGKLADFPGDDATGIRSAPDGKTAIFVSENRLYKLNLQSHGIEWLNLSGVE